MGSLAALFFAFGNFSQTTESSFSVAKKNDSLKIENDDYAQKIIAQEENIKEKNSKKKTLEEEMSKFNALNQKANINQLYTTLQNYLCDYDSGIFDFSYANHTKSTPGSLAPLNGHAIEPVTSRADAIDNLSLLGIFMNDYNFRLYNSYVAKNNSEIMKTMGILEYLQNGPNYLIKSQLLENTSEIELFKQNYCTLAALKERELDNIENIFGLEAENYLKNQREKLVKIKDKNMDYTKVELKKEDLKKLNSQEIFAIELLNASSPYLNELTIQDNGTEKRLNKGDYTLMKEEKGEAIKKLTYYNNRREEISSSQDLMN